MSEVPYTTEFFDEQRAASVTSARHVVPIVVDLIGPRSVVDVGCGIGGWLSVFAEHDILDSIGIDGDYVDRSELLIPAARFLGRDLAEPVELDRRFDLALSLEVAEHLPEASAGLFVRSLTQLAPTVLFSAAVPGQGGIHHVNEQWPSYWASRFAEHDFVAIDALRPRVWNNKAVAWWYAQNMLLFVSPLVLEARTQLRIERDCPRNAMDLVHPRMYEGALRAWEQLTTRRLLGMLPRAMRRSISWRTGPLR